MTNSSPNREVRYVPDEVQYRRNLLSFTGSLVSHIPNALFDLPDSLLRQYGVSSRCLLRPVKLTFCNEAGSRYYIDASFPDPVTFRPDACRLLISTYGDRRDSSRLYLSVELCPAPSWHDGILPAAGVEEQVPPGAFPRQEVAAAEACVRRTALVLQINRSLRERFYVTASRFLKANRGKYVMPGMRADGLRHQRLAVFDTEMERPYPIQFAGILLEREDGGWKEVNRLDTYIRLPAGVRLSWGVRKVTHLDDAVLRQKGCTEREADERIRDFLQQADLVCGHAVLADKEIMRGSLQRQQIRLPYCLWREEMVDTQILLKALYGQENMVSLEKAAELTGVGKEGDAYHDARTDAAVTARIFMLLEPEFTRQYGVEPVVCDPMMHAPRQSQLFNLFQKNARLRGTRHGGSPDWKDRGSTGGRPAGLPKEKTAYHRS